MTERGFIKAVAQAIDEATTPQHAAEKVYEICCKAAEAWGMKPETEVAIRKPGERRHHPDTACWSVCFEAGPYQWAIDASMDVSGKGDVLAEPYYNFDLCFSEA